ncbi:hypothetical protein CAPTEDRAFT_196688 [Capitella teleta]|uniref:P2X purinoreceptor 7 intracellular domain-containing protein n=1 Tax=Capitella teleta TaxID=283909 RepID=R7VKH1_CAPTE|nr:hypothetical protein CAPTEDRAFT_196688 [Capitella teleta]|eukprot:ELU17366.1 hypothetical protein CAPTEDRAFT_196688 [Capitella teleta]
MASQHTDSESDAASISSSDLSFDMYCDVNSDDKEAIMPWIPPVQLMQCGYMFEPLSNDANLNKYLDSEATEEADPPQQTPRLDNTDWKGNYTLHNRRYRYTAYRQFTMWIHGYLGRKLRVVIPACAVAAICHQFSSPQYYGFKYPH